MKTIKNAVFIVTLIVITFSCSKKDDEVTPAPKVYAEENPLAKFLIDSGFNGSVVSTIELGGGMIETGMSFKPKVKGKINALVVKLPYNEVSLKVTIWDLESQLPIRTEAIVVPTNAVEVKKIIVPIELIKDKSYVISMRTKSAYLCQTDLLNPVPANFPINVENISILNSNYSQGNVITRTFPNVIALNKYSGNCSFIFQQTE